MSEFISFSIGENQYGLEIMAVREIRGWAGVNPLPRQPDEVLGVLDLRGVMVPIIDLRCRFGGGRTETTPMHVVIIVQIDQRLIGILADRVIDIVEADDEKIQPVPQVVRNSQSALLSGLVADESGMLALINLRNLAVSDIDPLAEEAVAAA